MRQLRSLFSMLMLGLSASGCSGGGMTDAEASEIVTAIVGPRVAHDQRGQAPKDGVSPPYWKLGVARGYLATGTAGISLGLDALYPTMEHFRPSIRERWFLKKPDRPDGVWGEPTTDILRITIQYTAQGNNDLAAVVAQRAEEGVRNGTVVVGADLPRDLQAPIPGLRHYRLAAERVPSDIGQIIFIADDGRTVLVTDCLSLGLGRDTCKVSTTWQSRLRVEYRFPRVRWSELVDIDRAVQRLIDSFHPELVE